MCCKSAFRFAYNLARSLCVFAFGANVPLVFCYFTQIGCAFGSGEDSLVNSGIVDLPLSPSLVLAHALEMKARGIFVFVPRILS